MKRIRHRVYVFLEPDVVETKGEKYFDLGMIVLILLNIVALMVDTVESIHAAYGPYLATFEDISIGIFAVEYFLRVWSIVEDKRYSGSLWGRIKFVFTPMALVDLFSFLPAILFVTLDLRFLRILRVLRVIRLFKIVRYVEVVKMMDHVIKAKRSELIMSFVFVVMVLVMVSFILFYAENSVQPDKFSSVPQTMWWSVETLTTVGYGDIVPVTAIGQFLAGLIAILGIGLFAIPTSIITAGYLEEFSRKKHHGEVCPTCGQPITHHT